MALDECFRILYLLDVYNSLSNWIKDKEWYLSNHVKPWYTNNTVWSVWFFYFRLHEKHPWYSEQLTFLLVNTDNNGYLTKDEFFEAAKVSPDMQALNFSYKQLENLVDGLIAIGDQV